MSFICSHVVVDQIRRGTVLFATVNRIGTFDPEQLLHSIVFFVSD